MPDGPDGPEWSPKQAAQGALELYDKNADGFIDAEEVEASPGLKIAFERVDTDQDGQLNADEIAQRVRYYETAPVAVISGETQIFFRNRPLPGATVTYEPESFLGESFKPCVGVTNADGIAYVSREAAEFPGIYLGFYRVRVSTAAQGKEIVPEQFNTETTLGYEAADDLPFVSNIVQFNLKR